MDFELSPQVSELRDRVRAFMDEHVYPAEAEALRALDDEVAPGVAYPQILIEIRERARNEGLWNMFMPDERYGAGLTNWEYGVLCEEMGRSPAIAVASLMVGALFAAQAITQSRAKRAGPATAAP